MTLFFIQFFLILCVVFYAIFIAHFINILSSYDKINSSKVRIIPEKNDFGLAESESIFMDVYHKV